MKIKFKMSFLSLEELKSPGRLSLKSIYKKILPKILCTLTAFSVIVKTIW